MNGAAFNTKPLAGRRIVVTRARRQGSRLSEALKALGAEVIELPLIEIVPPESYASLDHALQNISQYQWLIVTSANTVRVLAERVELLALGNSTFTDLKTVVVGPATAAAMKQQGWHVDFVPDEYVAESLVAVLENQVKGGRVLLARASSARDVIPDELTRLRATVDVVEVYRTLLPSGAREQFRKIFGAGINLPHAVTFTSSSTVKHFYTLLREASLSQVPAGVEAISIGPVTSATLRDSGWEPAVQAQRHDVEGLVQSTLLFFSRTQ